MAAIYQDISRRMLSEFQSGAWWDGALLPSEAELGKAFAVSRTTIRRALAVLEADGHIERRQGAGSFLRARMLELRIEAPLPFGGAGGMTRRRSVALSINARASSLAEAALFSDPSLAEVFEVRRLLFLAGRPAVYQIAVLRHPELKRLSLSEFDNTSFYSLLRDRFDIRVARVRKRVTAANADEFAARLLGIRIGAAVLRVRRVVFDDTGAAFETSDNFIRGDAGAVSYSGDCPENAG